MSAWPRLLFPLKKRKKDATILEAENGTMICRDESSEVQSITGSRRSWRGWIFNQFKWCATRAITISTAGLYHYYKFLNASLPCRRLSPFDICFYIWCLVIPMQSKRGCSSRAAVDERRQQGDAPRIQEGPCHVFRRGKSSEPGPWLARSTVRPSATACRTLVWCSAIKPPNVFHLPHSVLHTLYLTLYSSSHVCPEQHCSSSCCISSYRHH